MKKEYNHNGIEIIRANNDQVYACFKLFGALQLIRTLVPDLERRLKAIPYGKRDYMNALQKLDRISADIIQTYPIEKVAGMLPQAKRMVLECHVVKPVVSDPAYAVINAEDFEGVCEYAFEGNCKICTELNCDKCKLGKIFDRHMVKDRGKDDWMSIGLDAEGE